MENIAKNTIREINGMIIRSELSNFYRDMSKITDMQYFSQIINSKDWEEKRKIEEGIIYLTSKEDLEDFERIFLSKYNQYIIETLENDVTEYYNNTYCNNLLSNAWSNLSPEDDPNEVKFFNGKSLGEIDIMIVTKANQIIEKLEKKVELDEKERMFIENTFLSTVFEDQISKNYQDGEEGLMRNVIDYFKKYPIKDLSTPRNQQLSLLYNLAIRMFIIPTNSAILFDYNYEDLGGNSISLASFNRPKNSNGIPSIKINDLDPNSLYSIKTYLERVFTIFHELGHFNQEYDDFNEEIKKIIEMEYYIIENDLEFYHKYHDSFLIERDADAYAASQLIEEYGKIQQNGQHKVHN